jgi:hypothetical protein
MTTDVIEQLAERGQAIYDQKLKAILEPEQNGRVVAIHVDTEDYGLGRNSQEAVRAARATPGRPPRHPHYRPVARLRSCRPFNGR